MGARSGLLSIHVHMEQRFIAWRTSQIKAGVQILDSQFKIKLSNFM